MKQKTQTPDLREFKEPDEKLIYELNKLIMEKRIWPEKIFIVGKKKYFLVYQGITSNGMNAEEFGTIIPKHLKRGDILDSFSKIELIINEIFESEVLGKDGKRRSFSDIVEKIDLSQKVHLLKSWELISQETFYLLHKVRKVRNIIAHSWHIKNAIYEKDKTLETNFKQFQEDLKLIWSRLINVYDFLKPQNKQLENILKQIKKALEENEN